MHVYIYIYTQSNLQQTKTCKSVAVFFYHVFLDDILHWKYIFTHNVADFRARVSGLLAFTDKMFQFSVKIIGLVLVANLLNIFSFFYFKKRYMEIWA